MLNVGFWMKDKAEFTPQREALFPFKIADGYANQGCADLYKARECSHRVQNPIPLIVNPRGLTRIEGY
jgi:hypothetical protein